MDGIKQHNNENNWPQMLTIMTHKRNVVKPSSQKAYPRRYFDPTFTEKKSTVFQKRQHRRLASSTKPKEPYAKAWQSCTKAFFLPPHGHSENDFHCIRSRRSMKQTSIQPLPSPSTCIKEQRKRVIRPWPNPYVFIICMMERDKAYSTKS